MYVYVMVILNLDQDYDWRQYASGDNQQDVEQEISLRTRLASQPPTSSNPDTISTCFEDTLSESMVLA